MSEASAAPKRPPCALAIACMATVLVNLFDIVIHIRGESGWESRCWSCVVQFLAVLCILLIPVATKPGALLSEKGARGTVLLYTLIYYIINGAWIGANDLAGRTVLFILLTVHLVLFFALAVFTPRWWGAVGTEAAASEKTYA